MLAAKNMMGKRHKESNEALLMKFLRFIAVKVGGQSCQFDVKKGHLKMKRGRLLISVRDPFLHFENHGYYLKDQKKFQRLIIRVKTFIQDCAQGRIEEALT